MTLNFAHWIVGQGFERDTDMAFVNQHPNLRGVLHFSCATIMSLACSVLPLIVGTVLPHFGGGFLQEPVNLIWGFVFGLGWYLAGFVASVRSPRVVLWGAVIWPALVCAFLFIFSRRLLQHERSSNRMVILSAFFLSLIVVVPQTLTVGPALRNIPFFPNILAAVY